MEVLKNLSLAIRFLTIFPLPAFSFKSGQNKVEEISGKNLAQSMTFFPLVGLLIGIFLLISRKVFLYCSLPPLVSDALILIIWIWLSGGLHLDGFTDSIDGFAGGKNKEEILAIMHDGAAGAKGILALFSLLLLKYILLVESFPLHKDALLLFTPVVGRWSMVMSAFLGKPAHSNRSLGKLFMDNLSWKEFFLATLIMGGIGFLILGFSFLYFILAGVVIVLLGLSYSQKRIGGINGDIIGAINEIVELFALFTYCLLNSG